MKIKMKNLSAVLAGLCATGALWMSAPLALAQTEQCDGSHVANCIPLNGGGSSAATPFMTQVPLDLLDDSPTDQNLLPIHYVNGDITGPPAITAGKLHVWTGTRGGASNPTVIRYSATGSSDGIKKLQNPTSDTTNSFMTFLDHNNAGACSAATLVTRPSDGRKYWERTGCTGIVSLPVHMGASDVAGSSFHQTGPLVPLTKVTPIDQSALTSTQVAMVPWSFVVGNKVKKVDPISGNIVPVVGFSRTEIEAIFSRQVTDWSQVGLVLSTNGTTPDGGAYPITLCVRSAGSGSKAALDETVMVNAAEASSGTTNLSGTAPGVYFGGSTQDVIDCIQGNSGLGRSAHPAAIGYMDADQTVNVTGGYPVRLDGFFANDASLSDPKINIRCGKYLYWAGERLNVRNYSDSGITSQISALATAFIADAQSSTVISHLPAGAFWVAASDMYVSKAADAGPIAWNSGAHPCAQ